VLEVLYHHAKFGGARILPATRSAKNVEFFCLSVMLLNVRVCAPDFAMKALEYRNDFDAVGLGKVCSCPPMFNFRRLLSTGDTTKCLIPKNRQNWDFFANRGRRINRLRRNLPHKRIP